MTRLDDLRSTLTDAGHTVVGFAAIAAKKAIDARNDLAKNLADRTELDDRIAATVAPLVGTARVRATRLLSIVEDVTADIDARIDPFVDAATDRLPAPVAKPVHQVVVELRRVRSDVRGRAHQVAERVLASGARPAHGPAGSPSAAATASRKSPASKAKTSTVKAAGARASAPTSARQTAGRTVARKPTKARKAA